MHDLFFRPLFAFFLVEHRSRRVVHVGLTRHPTDAWVTQQLREATPFGEAPRFLIRDNDAKYGAHFDRLAAASGIRVLRPPVRAPRANATCERFLGGVRRQCLDHLLILGEAHLRRVLGAYVAYFNHDRPHQGAIRPSRRDHLLRIGKVRVWDAWPLPRSWAVSTTTIVVSRDRPTRPNACGWVK